MCDVAPKPWTVGEKQSTLRHVHTKAFPFIYSKSFKYTVWKRASAMVVTNYNETPERIAENVQYLRVAGRQQVMWQLILMVSQRLVGFVVQQQVDDRSLSLLHGYVAGGDRQFCEIFKITSNV